MALRSIGRVGWDVQGWYLYRATVLQGVLVTRKQMQGRVRLRCTFGYHIRAAAVISYHIALCMHLVPEEASQ